VLALLNLPLPPTVNHAYIKARGGKRILSPEGRAYKEGVTATIVRRNPQLLRFFQKDMRYFVVMQFYFENLENEGWKPDGTGTAKNRFKMIDVTNRVKLFEDAVKDAGGYDDSAHTRVLIMKDQGLPERVNLWAWNIEHEGTPFDGAIREVTTSH